MARNDIGLKPSLLDYQPTKKKKARNHAKTSQDVILIDV
jgi:hypothetical protein